MNWYQDALKDPRWRKKREEILRRDDGQCTECDNKKELEVHHKTYLPGRDSPWDYPDFFLATLCRSCHEGYN